MTCAQVLLRLLWGGPEVGVLRDWPRQPTQKHRIAIPPLHRVNIDFYRVFNLYKSLPETLLPSTWLKKKRKTCNIEKPVILVIYLAPIKTTLTSF